MRLAYYCVADEQAVCITIDDNDLTYFSRDFLLIAAI